MRLFRILDRRGDLEKQKSSTWASAEPDITRNRTSDPGTNRVLNTKGESRKNRWPLSGKIVNVNAFSADPLRGRVCWTARCIIQPLHHATAVEPMGLDTIIDHRWSISAGLLCGRACGMSQTTPTNHNCFDFFDLKSFKHIATVGGYGRFDLKIGIGLKFL